MGATVHPDCHDVCLGTGHCPLPEYPEDKKTTLCSMVNLTKHDLSHNRMSTDHTTCDPDGTCEYTIEGSCTDIIPITAFLDPSTLANDREMTILLESLMHTDC